MAARGPETTVKILGDASQLAAEMKKAGAAVEGLGKTSDAVSDKMVSAGKKMSMMVTAPVLIAMGAATKSAADLGETINKVDVIFGSGAKAVSAFADTATKSFGLSKQSAMDFAGGFGAFTKQLGDQQKSAEASIALVKRAADISSLFNVSSQQAADAIKSGLAGQSEPLRQFGVLLTEGKVKQEAYASGIARIGSELTEGQKVQARYNLILKESAVAQGDYAKTASGLPNTLRTLKEETKNVSAEMGQKLIPITTAGANAMIGMLHAVEKLPGPVQGAALALGGVAAAAGPILGAAGNAMKGIEGISSGLSKLKDMDGNLTRIGTAVKGLAIAAAVAGAVSTLVVVFDEIQRKKFQKTFQEIADSMAGIGKTPVQSVAALADHMSKAGFEGAKFTKEASNIVSEFTKIGNVVGASKFIDALDANGTAPDRIKYLRTQLAEFQSAYKATAADIAASQALLAADTKAMYTNADATKVAAFVRDGMVNSMQRFMSAIGVEISLEQKLADARILAVKAMQDKMSDEDRADGIAKGIASAERARADQQVNSAKAVQQAQQALNDVRAKAPALAAAVALAETGVKNAQLDLYNATENQKRAEEELNKSFEVAPPNIKAVEDAERSLDSARKTRKSAEEYAVRAQEDLTAANEDLADQQQNGSVRAERTLERARRDATRAVLDLEAREKARTDALARGGYTQSEMTGYELDIEDARDRVRDTTEKVTKAEKALNDVGEDTAKKAKIVAEKADAVTEAQKKVEDATKAVGSAETVLAAERAGRVPSQEEIQKKVEALKLAMANVATETDKVKGKEADLAGARATQKKLPAEIAAAEETLKKTTVDGARDRQAAVDAVTDAYRAQAEYLMGEEYKSAVAFAATAGTPSTPAKSYPSRAGSVSASAANNTVLAGYTMADYKQAIHSIETPGYSLAASYKAQSPNSTASGRYQVTDDLWGGYGKVKHAKDASPAVQEAFFEKTFGRYVKLFGVAGAAVAWFQGEGVASGKKKPIVDANGTTQDVYVKRYLNELSSSKKDTPDAVKKGAADTVKASWFTSQQVDESGNEIVDAVDSLDFGDPGSFAGAVNDFAVAVLEFAGTVSDYGGGGGAGGSYGGATSPSAGAHAATEAAKGTTKGSATEPSPQSPGGREGPPKPTVTIMEVNPMNKATITNAFGERRPTDNSTGGGNALSGATVYVTVQGSVISENQLVSIVRNGIIRDGASGYATFA